MLKVFRYEVDGLGIFEASSKACPVGDSRRIAKPDVSWLPQEGRNFPGAISFWKELGKKIYHECGLKNWQESVVVGQIQELQFDYGKIKIVYEDDFQVIGYIES